MISFLLRLFAIVAFVVLGIVWASERTETLALVWAASLALVAMSAVWADLEPRSRPTLSGLWDALPSPSQNPDDYR
ncbi:hypothetical protein [Conexibacter sp. CPCC 206217]|uniref:hypothetical protein n=1 Tax=Conexibacter sp. CPCC 206217 TaxID=3064574 RepID=UPI002716220C|nr:hypothetical protein [Conexibacter sp. CPCC 206217]MDO8214194.1 hypothetical protein [Conexibacter sp. CPCC 206217]